MVFTEILQNDVQGMNKISKLLEYKLVDGASQMLQKVHIRQVTLAGILSSGRGIMLKATPPHPGHSSSLQPPVIPRTVLLQVVGHQRNSVGKQQQGEVVKHSLPTDDKAIPSEKLQQHLRMKAIFTLSSCQFTV